MTQNFATATPPAGVDAVVADALRLLQDRGSQVLNAIDDGVVFLDRMGRTIFVNEAASRILGFTNREMLGQSMHELTHHHYADGSPFPAMDCPILSSVTDAVQQRVGGDTFWTKTGKKVPVDYTSIPIKEGRTVVGVVITFRDIIDQQVAEQQAARFKSEREARAEYRSLAEAIPVQVWTALPDGRLDYATQRVADYFGTTCERILGDGWRSLIHPDDVAEVTDRWAHSLATGAPYEAELRLRRHDGQYRRHLGRAVAQRDEDGAIVRWFGTNTDVEGERAR